MPASTTDYKKVIKAREEAKRKGESVAERVGMANTFESRLRDRLRKQKVSEGASRLEEMAGSAWGAYSGAPEEIGETYANLTPKAFTQGVGARQADVMGDIGQIAAMQQTRQQGIGDIIAGVATGIQAETQKQQALAQQAQQTYQNLLGEYQWGQEQTLARQRLAAQQAGGAAGLTPGQLIDVLGDVGEARSEQAATQNEAQNKINKLDRAIELLESGKVKTGPFAGRALKFGAKSPLFGTPEQEEFYRLSQEIATGEMFKIGGKVLPAQEIERLTPYIPADLTQSTSKIKGDLKNLRDNLTDQYNSMQTRPTSLVEQYLGLTEQQPAQGGEWEIVE